MEIIEVVKFVQTYGTVGSAILTALYTYHRWNQHRLDSKFKALRSDIREARKEAEEAKEYARQRDIQIMRALQKTGVSTKTGKAGPSLWAKYGFQAGEVN